MSEEVGLKYLHPANITEMFKIIKSAQPVRSLYGKDFPEKMKKIRIVYLSQRGEAREFVISIFPFSTLLDIKIAVYLYIKNHHEEFGVAEDAEAASPIFQSILFNIEELGIENASTKLGFQ